MNCLVNKFIFVVPDMPDKIQHITPLLKGFFANGTSQFRITQPHGDMRTLEHHQVLRHEQFQLKQRNGVIH